MKRHLVTALCCALVLAWPTGPAMAQTGNRPDETRLIMMFFDVGQGDATLIRTPRGKHVLIDAGPGDFAMTRAFFEFEPDTLDFVIASHNHADHIGGMPWVFNRFVVRAYMDNGVRHTTNTYRRTLAAVEREPGLQYLQATERTIRIDSVTIRILPPPLLDASQNNNSVGVIVEYGGFSAFFSGDSERAQLNRWLTDGRIRRVAVLKAAHHGAANGFTAALARAAAPNVVVVSAGAMNRYGHPSPTVLRAWTDAGAKVYRTDIARTVFVVATPDGQYDVIETSKRVLSAPIRP